MVTLIDPFTRDLHHSFTIDLLPFELGSFDVVVGMDWLSKFRAEIICHDKIVRIPLPSGYVLEVHGECWDIL